VQPILPISDRAIFKGFGPVWSAPVAETGTNEIMGYRKTRVVPVTTEMTEVRCDVSDLPAAPGNAVTAVAKSGKIFDATSNVAGTELAAVTDDGFVLVPGDDVEFEWISRLAA
jgi:hypothetical protein